MTFLTYSPSHNPQRLDPLTNGHGEALELGAHHDKTSAHVKQSAHEASCSSTEPIAICGMACRLPGNVHSPAQLWDFLLSKQDARSPVPASRFNASAFHADTKKPRTTVADHGYYLDESVDLDTLDTSFFPMARDELEAMDPQQRLLLEVAAESVEDAGKVGWRGTNIGVYVGSFGNDSYDVAMRDAEKYGHYQITTTHDFALSNRLSYELDVCGPSMTIRTACSSSLIALNEACMAISKGDCTSAIVAGSNLVMAPALTTAISEQGALSPDGSCKTFSSAADGYARADGIVAIFVQRLDEAIREGSPIRAIIAGTAVNSDGRTPGFTVPSATAQETLIRHAYKTAGISENDVAKTGYFECHGTGTPVGDLIETTAIGNVFGVTGGIHLGSVKPNLGHGEGASGLTAILKAVLALENRVIPPNIKCHPLNDKIPFQSRNLTVSTDAVPWPEDRYERASVNSFGIGGANAHVILDSPVSRGIVAATAAKKRSSSSGPQLLVYSANSVPSLQAIGDNYSKLLTQFQDISIANVAYTLANHRDHLPHRSFSVATKLNQSAVSAPTAPGKKHSLVMVFSGQGAQWPQMGRDLLRTNNVFRDSIESCDKHLQALGCQSWSIKEELLKPAKTSRVNEAQFSQPLCTAFQLAIVDALEFIGVAPSAVVGHSSGEIAAAYAAGALTAAEAIGVAYLRGLATIKQQRSGAMAAIGLGWTTVEGCLLPGVTVACDNSPRSVTISGDSESVHATVEEIKSSHPEALTTILKVEKAYHSYHMTEIGDDYQNTMEEAGIRGAAPTLPFYSSVTGTLLETQGDGTVLGPGYWRRNLESPVLFNAAACNIVDNPAFTDATPLFLEVGPHSALAGPLRQIVAHKGSTAPYVPVSIRRENNSETFMTAIGKLWTFHIPVNFRSLMPQGSCLPGLPTYPWNHQAHYWRESRVSRDWRMRAHAHHDLLGAKVPESSDTEPIWRNLFLHDHLPWICDHKIKDDIIFPFAGYVSMAAEAARQVAAAEEGVELRHVRVITALVVREGAHTPPTELVTSFRQARIHDFEESTWWDFGISSHNGNGWTKHCFGQIRAMRVPLEGRVTFQEALPHRVNEKQWYERVYRDGLQYGPHFAVLEELRTSVHGHGLATAEIRNNCHGDEVNYHLHPVVLDTCFQAMSAGAHHGFTHAYQQFIPQSVESLVLRRCSVDRLAIKTSSATSGDGIIGEATVMGDLSTVLQASGIRLARLVTGDITNKDPSSSLTARCEWVTDVDLTPFEDIVKPIRDHSGYAPVLEELTRLAIVSSKQLVSTIDDAVIESPHYRRYKLWLDRQDFPELEALTMTDIEVQMTSLFNALQDTAASDVAIAIKRVSENILEILSDQKDATEVLGWDGTVSKLNRFIKDHDISGYLTCLAHGKPNLSVLEIRNGFEDMSDEIMKQLVHANGQTLCSTYVCTHTSPTLVSLAKETFKTSSKAQFVTLDISQDPEKSGFEFRDFDLIIAMGGFDSTPNLQHCLQNIRKLLSPRGHLLVQQTRSDVTWINYVLGTLPGSVTMDDGNISPHFGLDRWRVELSEAGFNVMLGAVPDAPEPFCLNRLMLARNQPVEIPSQKEIKLVLETDDAADDVVVALVRAFNDREFQVSHITLDQTLEAGEDAVVFVDHQKPFFRDISRGNFEAFTRFVDKAARSGSGIIWLTKASQTHCPDPSYAPVIGAARTARAELGVDFATCEVDDFGLPQTLDRVASVVQKFHDRKKEAWPNFEYAITKDRVCVGRIFSCPLYQEECASQTPGNTDAIVVEQPGRLDSIKWSTRPTAAVLESNNVEVEVHAVGLNFRDLMEAMGRLDLNHGSGLGVEASGTIRRVGPGVTQFRAGDRVIAMCFESLAATITCRDDFCQKIPDTMSFVDASTLGVVFQTAIHALINIGRLEKGQSVLIHSGCGGVGLAAIQVARMLGAEIYTTVGSEEKARYLVETMSMPRDRIFTSRTPAFLEGVMRSTGGRGVDLALNSLSGECLQATWLCVAKWGTLVEIGKADLLGAGKLDLNPFIGSRTYSSFDLRQMGLERPYMTGRLLQSIMTYYNQGHIKPIPVDKVFAASEVQHAYHYMQQGVHIGKIVVSLRSDDGQLALPTIRAAPRREYVFDPEASYLLIGGLGGLGRSVSVWMAQRGARNLVFLSRSAGKTTQEGDFITMLQSMGCRVKVVAGSVACMADVCRAMRETGTRLKGILHMAMALHDQAFANMSFDDWNGATESKIAGSWNLHQASIDQGADLDFFVLFSSLSGVLGQPGQANYAAANAFIDAFAQYRTGLGLPCSSLALGAIEGVGYLLDNDKLLKKMRGTGWNPVREEELLEALEAAMFQCKDQSVPPSSSPSPLEPLANNSNILVGVSPSIPLSSSQSSARLRNDVRMLAYHNAGSLDVGSGSGSVNALQAFLNTAKSKPETFKNPETAAFLAQAIGKKLFTVLLKSDEEVNIATAVSDLGLDSLIAVEIRSWWKQMFNADISILQMLSVGTLKELGKKAAEQLSVIHGG